MCLAIAGCIVEINDREAQVKIGDTLVTTRLDLIGEVKVGDYVLVHAGFAINTIDKEDAEELDELWAELGGASW
jgi:hydrogenase expression/formation protein HypC